MPPSPAPFLPRDFPLVWLLEELGLPYTVKRYERGRLVTEAA